MHALRSLSIPVVVLLLSLGTGACSGVLSGGDAAQPPAPDVDLADAGLSPPPPEGGTPVDGSPPAVDRLTSDGPAPDAAASDAAAPDASAPDAAAPDAAVPDAVAPDAAVPDAAEPDVAAPPGVSPNQRPFDPNHPVYQPIPAACPLYQHSAAIVDYIVLHHREIRFDIGGETPSVYVGRPSDPVYTLSIHGATFNVHTPIDAAPGTGADYPLVILDEVSTDYGGIPVEYRMWQVTIDHSSRTIACNGGGVGCYANDGQPHYSGLRATGHAEIYGQNTGSGESYTVGMIRPIDVQRGRIDHAMRVAIGYPHSQRWFWPATRTEQQAYAAANDDRCPMGARIFLDAAVDAVAVGDAAAARLSNPQNQAFARLFVEALQEFGMIALDGTTGSHNVYFEGDATAGWEALIGPKNSYGSYNDIARAIQDVLPWDQLRVADEAVFDGYAR